MDTNLAPELCREVSGIFAIIREGYHSRSKTVNEDVAAQVLFICKYDFEQPCNSR